MDNVKRSLKKFIKFFKKGFYDETYLEWERNYKWNAHLTWKEELNRKEFERLLKEGDYEEIAKRAVRIESRTNLLFSFEKMALRDAVNNKHGAELFAKGLYNFLYGQGSLKERFENWINVVSQLPRKQTRVLTWPLVTVFGFIAEPEKYIFLKPMVTKKGAKAYGYPFEYASKPNWNTYKSLFDFSKKISADHPSLKPRDYIDLQSFIWTLGSDEYS
jgi:hypothetical protein